MTTFVSSLAGRLMQFKEELAAERDGLERARSEMPSRIKAVQAEAEQAAKALFGTKTKIEAALKKLKALVDREARLILDIERRERAIDFFAYLLNQTNEWQTQFAAVTAYCVALTRELSQEIQRIQHERREVKPFVEQLKPANLADDIQSPEPQDFLTWLRESKSTNVLGLASLRVSEFKAVLMDYGYSDKRVQEVKNKRINEILRAMPAKERLKCINRLDMMAAPLWQYNEGEIAGDKSTCHIYLFGVEDRDNTVIVPEEIAHALSSVYPPLVISTGDPKRVVCFKVETAVPAHVVNNMPRYREKYLDPNRPFPYHVHRDWERDLPDLFPGAEEEDARKYWSLGLADPFNLIVKKGEHYYIKSELKGERTRGYLVKLGQGRREAMKAFIADQELVSEARDVIDRINGELGNKQVSEKLQAYGLSLQVQVGKQGTTEEIRKSVELELGDIEEYVRSLSSL